MTEKVAEQVIEHSADSLQAAQHIAHSAEHAANAADHAGGAGADFIMHHILAQPVIELPTVFGIDLTITNHILMMWIVSALLILAFGLSFRRKSMIPKGLANALEATVVYLRDDIILPNMGTEGMKYAPYLLTAFFFVLLCNLLGLVPGAATATGNIGVTATLAMLTLIVEQIAGIKKHGVWGNMKHLIPGGLPVFLIPIMIPVELVSMMAKHIALAIRLFANMIAGHITILAIMSLIFIFKSWIIAPAPLLIIVFCALLEILIAFIQAYVFTILSAVFIGASLSEEH